MKGYDFTQKCNWLLFETKSFLVRYKQTVWSRLQLPLLHTDEIFQADCDGLMSVNVFNCVTQQMVRNEEQHYSSLEQKYQICLHKERNGKDPSVRNIIRKRKIITTTAWKRFIARCCTKTTLKKKIVNEEILLNPNNTTLLVRYWNCSK